MLPFCCAAVVPAQRSASSQPPPRRRYCITDDCLHYHHHCIPTHNLQELLLQLSALSPTTLIYLGVFTASYVKLNCELYLGLAFSQHNFVYGQMCLGSSHTSWRQSGVNDISGVQQHFLNVANAQISAAVHHHTHPIWPTYKLGHHALLHTAFPPYSHKDQLSLTA